MTKFVANLLGAELTVEGFPYMGQDMDVTVCTHSALWSCLRHFSQRYPEYPGVHPYEITQLTQDFSSGRLVPSQGLTMGQVTESLSRYGFHPRYYNEVNFADRSGFERLLHTYIESGIPAIIGLALPNGTGHAVVGIGHSSDFTRMLSPGIRWSHEYFSGLIMNDDNLPPYRSVLIDSRPDGGADTGYTLDNVDGFVVPLYEKIYLAAKDAFTIVEEIISHERTGLSRFQPPGLPPDDSLIRLFLTSPRSWKRNCRGSRIPGGLGLLYSTIPVPRFI